MRPRRRFGDIPDFPALAGDLVVSYGGITNLRLAPGGIIRVSHPLAGNGRAPGRDLLAPATPGSDAARRALDRRRPRHGCARRDGRGSLTAAQAGSLRA